MPECAAAFVGQFGMREETHRPDAVGEIDPHHALFGQPFARIIGHARRADGEPAAVNPHDHRQLFARQRGCPDIEVKAILAGRLGAEIMVHRPPATGLQAHRRKAVSVVDALPFRRWLRRLPAQFAHRRRGERNAQPGAHARRRASCLPIWPVSTATVCAASRRRNRRRKQRDQVLHLPAPFSVLWKKSNVALVAFSVAARVSAGVAPMKL